MRARARANPAPLSAQPVVMYTGPLVTSRVSRVAHDFVNANVNAAANGRFTKFFPALLLFALLTANTFFFLVASLS
jgi:hypothetical protein